jgi:hypothetical protein
MDDGVKTFFGKNRNQGGFDDPCVAQTYMNAILSGAKVQELVQDSLPLAKTS